MPYPRRAGAEHYQPADATIARAHPEERFSNIERLRARSPALGKFDRARWPIDRSQGMFGARCQVTREEHDKLAALLAAEHIAIIVTAGQEWPTATLQAFAETEALELVFIVGVESDKYRNLLKQPKATVFVDAREAGDVARFQITRASIQGIATEVLRGSVEWGRLQAIFLKKNPFEAPFFGSDKLRMVRVTPKRISYAGPGRDLFKTEV